MDRSNDDFRRRAKRIRLVVSDVDGVLTDGSVWYSEGGEALKRFSLRDGMGVERLRDIGVETAFLTRERSAIVLARAKKLRLLHCWLGVREKLEFLREQSRALDIDFEQIAYIGDDYNDLSVMREIKKRGLTAAPRDGMSQVCSVAHHVTVSAGGRGAFRDFAEWLLELREAE